MGLPIALSIAGSDPSGGAGIQADLRVFTLHGVYGCAAITTLTSQNTREITRMSPVSATELTSQITSVLADVQPNVIKIGMLGSVENVIAVAELLDQEDTPPTVIDPVFQASTGFELLPAAGIRLFRERLLPLASVITPNISEAALLLNCSPAEIESNIERSCRELANLGAAAVIIKGGHATGESADDFLFDGAFTRFSSARVPNRRLHGSGCTFASAVAARLASGMDLRAAVQLAKDFVARGIAAATEVQLGKGRLPLNHFAGDPPLDGGSRPLPDSLSEETIRVD